MTTLHVNGIRDIILLKENCNMKNHLSYFVTVRSDCESIPTI